MLTPSSRMSPAVSSIIRFTSRSAVVLPHPDGPTSTQISPAGTFSERPRIAGSDSPEYRFVTSRYSTDAARDVVLLAVPSEGTREMLTTQRRLAYDPPMLLLRAAFALLVTGLMVLLLANGQFGAAIFIVLAGVWLRRAAESGRLHRLARW